MTKYGSGMFFLAQLADHAHAVQAGHLHVEKDQVRLQVFDQLHGLEAVGGGGDNFDIGKLLQLIGELFGGELLIVHQDRGDDVADGSRQSRD